MNGVDGGGNANALGSVLAGLLEAPTQMATAFASSLARGGSCGCEIPPPCWEPRRAGTCRLTLTPGGSATIRVHVSNCDWTRHIVGITAGGKLAGWLKFQPTTLVVEAQERATFLVTVRVPDGIGPGQMLSGPILVRGCLDHIVRLEVRVAECAGNTCCDVVIQDCPDHVHHWYDHFYCYRPCNQSVGRLPNG